LLVLNSFAGGLINMSYRKRSMLGVTLLEIMLVLAIAAMILVMSVRFYQSTTASNQANVIVQQVQAILGVEDTNWQASGAFVNAANVTAALGANALTTPFGVMSVTGASATSVTIGLNAATPANICALVTSALAANTRLTTTTCTAMVYKTS
jgi:hypothetical protein